MDNDSDIDEEGATALAADFGRAFDEPANGPIYTGGTTSDSPAEYSEPSEPSLSKHNRDEDNLNEDYSEDSRPSKRPKN